MKTRNKLSCHLIAAIIGIASFQTHAQQVTIDGNLVKIGNGLVTSIDGNLTNKGELKNGGEIRVTGSWMNLGVYQAEEEGEVIFSSDEDQIINHNDQNFENFTIAGGGNKILMESLTINGQINFESGKIVVEDGSKLTFGPDAVLNGANEDSYIIGEIYRTGTGNLYYPIGTETEFLPVNLYEVEGDQPVVGFRIWKDFTGFSVDGNLNDISSRRYFEMFSDGNYLGGKIELPVADENIMDNTSQAVVAQSSAANLRFFGIGSAESSGTADAGAVLSAGVAYGPYFVVARVTSEAELPPIRVINVVTPFADGKHDFLRIENIELYENNLVELYNRAGQLVYRQENYNNQDRAFRGFANQGNDDELVTGNYYYSIRTRNNDFSTGYIFLKQ